MGEIGENPRLPRKKMKDQTAGGSNTAHSTPRTGADYRWKYPQIQRKELGACTRVLRFRRRDLSIPRKRRAVALSPSGCSRCNPQTTKGYRR